MMSEYTQLPGGYPLQKITDEFMLEMRATTKPYTVVILKKTPKRDEPGADKIIWEHGRRNHALRLDGVIAIVCPVNDGSDVSGVSIFTTNPDDTRKIMDGDPGVIARIFVYEIHPTRTFPGDRLPDPTA